MSIWKRIVGGWRTWGPNSPGVASFDAPSVSECVSSDEAIRLSALWACLNLRAESIGSLPLHLRDAKKNILTDHPLYGVLHDSPNSMQTAPEFWSMQTAHVDLYGNGISVIKRKTRDRSVVSLEPYFDPQSVLMHQEKSGAWYYDLGGEKFAAEDILHLRGFTTKGYWGMSRLEVGRSIFSAQLAANEFAIRAFKQGFKAGGFFTVEANLNEEQRGDWQKILDRYGSVENAGKFLTLLKGMKPIAGAEFRPKPADAELMTSRYFGIEEICRLMGVPPQLIGQNDKASSWASSQEQINLFFLMYSLQPTLIRSERRISKSLMSSTDRAAGIEAKFSVGGLLRADLKTRQAFYASALQNGYYNRDEVRDLEDRGTIPGGDKYTVQMNMTGIEDAASGDDKKEPQK